MVLSDRDNYAVQDALGVRQSPDARGTRSRTPGRGIIRDPAPDVPLVKARTANDHDRPSPRSSPTQKPEDLLGDFRDVINNQINGLVRERHDFFNCLDIYDRCVLEKENQSVQLPRRVPRHPAQDDTFPGACMRLYDSETWARHCGCSDDLFLEQCMGNAPCDIQVMCEWIPTEIKPIVEPLRISAENRRFL